MTTTPIRRPVASPCISLCRIDDDTGWCEGCFRTLEEIAAWGNMDDSGKVRVLDTIEARRASVAQPGALRRQTR